MIKFITVDGKDINYDDAVIFNTNDDIVCIQEGHQDYGKVRKAGSIRALEGWKRVVTEDMLERRGEVEVAGTLDLTPSWSGLLPALLAVIETGGPGFGVARDELVKMAKVADMCVELHKKMKEHKYCVVQYKKTDLGLYGEKYEVVLADANGAVVTHTIQEHEYNNAVLSFAFDQPMKHGQFNENETYHKPKAKEDGQG